MELNVESRKELAEKLLEQLLTTYYKETELFCEELNYKIEELSPVDPNQFLSKGTTSDLKDVRFIHHEERRIAKIIKIASEISKNFEGTFQLDTTPLKATLNSFSNQRISRNQSSQSSRSDSFSYFTSPREFISFGLGKEKEKFNRSLKILERLSFLRDEAKMKADLKRKTFEKKEKVIRKNLSKKENDFQRTVSSNIEKRKKILEKKYQILSGIDKEMEDYGVKIEKRMEKLTVAQKIEIREKLKKKEQKLRKKLEDQRKKYENDVKKTQEEHEFAEEMMKNIQRKIDKRVNDYLNQVQSRVQSARHHSLKVNNTLQTSFKLEMMNQTTNLRKNINKSIMSSKKIEKKMALASENSEKMKKKLNESFQIHQRGLSEINVEEIRRMERIKARQESKQKLFVDIRKDIIKKFEDKKQQNFIRMENHFRTYLEKQRNEVIPNQILKKQKVLEKHKKLSMIADELNNYKNEVSYNKRRNNLEIQKIRSSRGSPNTKLFYATARHFDKTL